MKRLTLFVMALTVTCLALAGCQKQKDASDGGAANNTAADITEATTNDTEAAQKAGKKWKTQKVEVAKNDEQSNMQVKVEIDYPVDGPKQVVDAVRAFIAETLEGIFYYGANSTRQPPHYNGNADDPDAFARFYAEEYMKYLVEHQPPRGTPMMIEFEIECEAAHQRYVTYETSLTQWMGGSHPNQEKKGVTLRTTDGQHITSFFNPGHEDAIKQLILADVDDEEKDFVRNAGLPATPPYLEGDELKFVYQENEIAPYVVGCIEAEVEIKKIRPYLNDSALELIKR